MPRPIVQVQEIVECLDSPVACQAQERPQDVGRREGVPERAMPGRVFDATEGRHLVQPAMTQLRNKATGQPDRAERPAGRCLHTCGGPLGREMAPVEPGVMRDEHPVLQGMLQIRRHIHEAGLPKHILLMDSGETGHPGRNRRARVEKDVIG